MVVTAGLLYLAITYAHGVAKYWTSLVTLVGAFGVSGASLRAAGQSAARGIEQEVWNSATLDARAWEVTWLPTLVPSLRQRYRPAGVSPPQIKKGLEAAISAGKEPAAATGPTDFPPPAPSGRSRADIDHVVVLALENRSFDHLLGYLDHPDPRFDGAAAWVGPYTNPGWNGAARRWRPPPTPRRSCRSTRTTPHRRRRWSSSGLAGRPRRA